MIYSDFGNIVINTDVGVSRPSIDTMIFSKHAKKIRFESALDIGTSTGFIPIYLSKCGLHCDGSDINIRAIECAKKNANKNKCKIDFYLSNLFENIQKKYDLIIFNTPLGNFKSSSLSKYLEIIKYFFPRQSTFTHKIIFKLIGKKQRIKLLTEFFTTCQEFLNKNGCVLINLDESELPLIRGHSFRIVDTYHNKAMLLVLIQY